VYYDWYPRYAGRTEPNFSAHWFREEGGKAIESRHERRFSADFDMLGFAAIGSGGTSAMSRYPSLKIIVCFPLATGFFLRYLSRARGKVHAESATDVGKTHSTCVRPRPQDCEFLSPITGGADAVRAEWLRTGAPQQSDNAIEIIENISYIGDSDAGIRAKPCLGLFHMPFPKRKQESERYQEVRV